MWLVDIEVQHWWLCNFNILLIPQPSLTIQPIHSDKHQTIISLLQSGHSCRQIARKTGISKSTIGRIAKKVETIKENITTGCPFKLSPLDKRRIIYQIESGKLDNAVQATDSINSINTHPISPQTVRNALKKDNMKAVVKKKQPLLKPVHRKNNWTLLRPINIGWLKTGRRWPGHMRPKPIELGQMDIYGSGKGLENHLQTGPPPQLSSMEEETSWYGTVWDGMRLGCL